MKRRYKVRQHASGNQDGEIAAGTIVQHIGGSVALEAFSIDDAETAVRQQIGSGKMARGRVYQIFPPSESSEALRSLAVALDGEFHDCYLETAHGLMAEFQRIRFR